MMRIIEELPMARLLMAVLLLASCAHSSAQELGRLFTTPAQRAALEQGRQSGRPPAPQSDGIAVLPAPGSLSAQDQISVSGEKAPVADERIIVVNGFVQRSGSSRVTAWIDSVPRGVNDRLGSGASLTQAGRGGRVELTLGSGKSVTLKPGQAVGAASGRVKER